MAKPIRNLKSVKDFIAFFEAIPANKWCTGSFKNQAGQCCAMGHLGRGDNANPEKIATANAAAGRLNSLIGGSIISVNDGSIISVNDGSGYSGGTLNYQELGATPKERVINYLTLAANGLHKVTQYSTNV